MRRYCARPALALPLLLLSVPFSALAQDLESQEAAEASPDGPATDPVARAREAFARGIACVEQHETACAERAFREALALHDAPTIRYNLASALFDLGRYPEAARLAAAVTADAEAPAEVRDHAETLLEQLRAQGAVLSLTLEGATDGVTVQLDGEEVPASQQGEILVAPGARVVTAQREGGEVARRELSLAQGAREEVTLTIAPSPGDVAPDDPVDPAPAGTPLHEDPTFWAVVGGGAAVIVAIVVIAAVVAATSGVEGAVEGNYEPGVLRW